MSSEEDDEFFDAPDAFGLAARKAQWSDSDEDSSYGTAARDNESKNAQRRDKVESLKRNLDDSITPPSTLPSRLNQSMTREENAKLGDPGSGFPHHYATESRVAGGIGQTNALLQPKVSQIHRQAGASAPECRLPSYENLDYVKSWSLDAARIQNKLQQLDEGGGLKDNQQEAASSPQPPPPPPCPGNPTSVMRLSGTAQQSGRRNIVSQMLARVSSVTRPSGSPAVVKSSPISPIPSFRQGDLANNSTKQTSDDVTVAKTSAPSADEEELLSHVPLTNLDTGEQGTLNQLRAATLPAPSSHQSPGGRGRTSGDFTMMPGHDSTLNPIELQFRERTKSNSSLQRSEDSDRLYETEVGARVSGSINGKIKKIQKGFRGAFSAMKSATRAKIFHPDTESSDDDEELVGSRGIRLRSSRRMRGRDFLQIKLVQEMKSDHTGAVWAMRFSPCGRLLATAGYDRHIRIWVLRQYYRYFKQMQKSADQGESTTANLGYMTAMSQVEEDDWLMDTESLVSASASTGKTDEGSTCSSGDDDLEHSRKTPFRSRPLLVYRGHEGVVTDLTWSKNLFLLATSMDRQVRLWHISRHECLCIFSHNDTVPTIVFHPKDDRYFLSGSLDGKLRLWNIPDKKVRFWVEAPMPSTLPSPALVRGGPEPKTVITCAGFACDGTKIAVGTYDGRIMFFNTELVYTASITIKSHHTKGHCRITAIEIDPTEASKILVTSNDSRVRLIDARDYHTLCKYRGFENNTSQIKATFSSTGKYIISGSENHFFYIWKKSHEVNRVSRFSTARKDRNNFWEAIKAHETVVTVAVFCPNPLLVLDKRLRRRPLSLYGAMEPSGSTQQSKQEYLGEVVVSADCNGCIRVFKNRMQVT